MFNSARTIRKVDTIHEEVLRVSGKLEAFSQRNLNADNIHEDHEKRLRILERWRHSIPLTALAGVGAVVLNIWQLKGH